LISGAGKASWSRQMRRDLASTFWCASISGMAH